ncbi:MAG TPA: histidinol-phosphatase HisJ family protein [Actinobacteria bacterium]|nr:histidinol-phosphatase HisJ family protein [Actinomycetota bacterium]
MAVDFPLADYHVHTARCGHAVGGIDEYVEYAKDLGLVELGFADHLPLFNTIDATLTMSWDQFPSYLADIRRLKKDSSRPKILMGIEVDYMPKFVEQTANILAEYDFDYVLGSVHFVDGWGIDDRRYIDFYEDYALEDLYERYFDLIIQAAESGLFDVLAHPDLIKKYFRLEKEPLDLYERVVKKLAATGIAIELSSAGLRKPCREPYPSLEFLKICRHYNIPVTLGSDAHAPEQVGADFGLLLEQLARVGYSEVVRFSERRRTTVGLT